MRPSWLSAAWPHSEALKTADECGFDGVVSDTWIMERPWTMRSADDWEAADRPECRSAFVAASKPIYVRDKNDRDEARVSCVVGLCQLEDRQIWFVPS